MSKTPRFPRPRPARDDCRSLRVLQPPLLPQTLQPSPRTSEKPMVKVSRLEAGLDLKRKSRARLDAAKNPEYLPPAPHPRLCPETPSTARASGPWIQPGDPASLPTTRFLTSGCSLSPGLDRTSIPHFFPLAKRTTQSIPQTSHPENVP